MMNWTSEMGKGPAITYARTSRRRFLSGAGLAILAPSLPNLPAMAQAEPASAEGPLPPRVLSIGSLSVDGMNRRDVRVGRHRFNVFEGGSGPAIFLIHGAPNSSALWRGQVPALLKAGYRVIAPDLLGLGDSDLNQDVGEYTAAKDTEHMLGILDALRVQSAVVVGTDRGAPPAWGLAALHPARVRKLVAISAGHNNSFANAGLDQRERSWYMLRYLFPDAEELVKRDDWAFLRRLYRHHPEMDTLIANLARPGGVRAGLLNWYHANVHPITSRWEPLPKVAVPTLGLWGTEDAELGEEQIVRSSEWVTGPWRYERLEGAGHFASWDRPELVTAAILRFVQAG